MSKRQVTSHHIYGTDIQEIVKRMKEISSEIEDRANELDIKSGPLLRLDPKVRVLWRKLCVLHMRGLVLCEDIGYNSEACLFIKEPQACQRILKVPKEETCCGRFFDLEENQNP